MNYRRAAALLAAAGALTVALWPRRPRISAQRILRISRVVANLEEAEAFYREALGFQLICHAAPFPDAREAVMQLGDAQIALVSFAKPGRPYPPDSRSNDLWFQHLAIVVDDMDAAYSHLCQVDGWQPVSESGPQLLPPENGSVRAFKFRDPDGHPLELIWFPSPWPRGRPTADHPIFLGIDHTALAIQSSAKSLSFYQALGFRVANRSLNVGPTQQRLDGLPNARARIIGLRPPETFGPGIELLGYQPPGRPSGNPGLNDIVTDWITIQVASLSGESHRTVFDPDGHRLLLVTPGYQPADQPQSSRPEDAALPR